MITVYKQHIMRNIQEQQLEEYLAAGWSRSEIEAEVIVLKPAAKMRGAAKTIPDNAIQQGDE